MPDWIRRGIRSFLQGMVATFLALIVGPALEPGYVPDLAWLQRIIFACAFGGLVGLVSWAHNFLEDNSNFPALLKSPPSRGVNPVPPTAGPRR